MLKVIRKKGVMRKILWFVASLILLSFGVLGQNYAIQNSRSGNYAGKIFGRKVSMDDFKYNFEQTQLQAMMQYGADFNRVRDLLNLPAQTWDRIILLHEANRRRIRVKDEDVVRAVQNYNIFQRNGVFDKKLYEDVLRYGFRIQERSFEEGVRDSLKFVQIFEQETKNVSIPEQEIFEAFRLKNEKMQVTYAFLPWERYAKDVVLDETKAKEYFLSHKEEFAQPAMVKVEFIRFDFPSKKESAEKAPTPTEKPNPDKDTPEKDKPFDEPSVSDADKNATFEQARKVMEDLAVNADLSAVARQRDLKIETSDFFSEEKPDLKNGWPFPLIQALLQAPDKDIIGPVETKDGFQIIKIKEKKESHIPEYDDVKSEAKEAHIRQEAMKIAKTKGAEYHTKILAAIKDEKGTFSDVVKANKLELDQTPLFVRGQYLPKIGLSREFYEIAFNLTKEKPMSGPVPTEKGYCILHLDTFVPVDPKDYEKQREEFSFNLLRERKNNVFGEFIARLRLKANLEDNLANVLPQK